MPYLVEYTPAAEMHLRTLSVRQQRIVLDVAEYTDKLGDEPVILTSGGKPIAALISLANVDLETIALSTNPHFVEIIEASRKQYKEQGGISADEMRQRLNLGR